jgi:DGC domain.
MLEAQDNGMITINVTRTSASCSIGDRTGERQERQGSTPVLSCEGACIRGELARLAANRLAQMEGFGRGCLGELLTAPESGMARWIQAASEVVCVDGCHMGCLSRILENQIDAARLRVFNAQGYHGKYSEVFGIDEIPECERKNLGASVAASIASRLADGGEEPAAIRGSHGPAGGCCGE